MNLSYYIFTFGFVGGLLACVLLVVFGQTTVRKLRKNPDTKSELGVEFLSGWDIFNVAQALALPNRLTKVLAKSSISYLYANTEILRNFTTKFDRFLAITFYWTLVLSLILILLSPLFK